MLWYWFGAFASSLNFKKIQHKKIICSPIGHCCQRSAYISVFQYLNDNLKVLSEAWKSQSQLHCKCMKKNDQCNVSFCVIQIWNDTRMIKRLHFWLNQYLKKNWRNLTDVYSRPLGEKVRIGISLIKVLAARHAGSGWLARPYRRLMSSACRGKPAHSHSSGEEQHLGLVSLFSMATIMKPYTWHFSRNLWEEPTVTLQITWLLSLVGFPTDG